MTPFQFDMALQRPVFYMMRRGIRVNVKLREELSEKYQEEWTKAQTSLNYLAGRPINVSSPGKVLGKYIYDELGCPVRKKDASITCDEDALRASMAFVADKMANLKQQDAKDRWLRALLSIKLMLKIREIRKLKQSYLDVELDRDDRARCTITVGGTETMRFSHSKTLWDTGLNLATVPHKLRTIFIPDDGYELAEFDLNRGESWVYTFLSLDPELLRIHTSGGDFHSETAAAIQSAFGGQGLTADEIKKLAKSGDQFGYKIRYLGKKVNHASAYRMGPFRAAEVVNEEADDTGITVVPTQMKKAQALWKAKYFGIQGWWDDIDRRLENDRLLRTPFGRQRQFFGFMADHLKKEATAYVPQSTSVDYLNRGMLAVYDELVVPQLFQLELLHQNHDSILVQYPIQHRMDVHHEIATRLMRSSIPINGHDVTIPVEGMAGQNWGDWHKDKNPGGLQEVKAA
jgi:DNA polymerase I-like protein with 3'-5' exonuclease and polymerase domains